MRTTKKDAVIPTNKNTRNYSFTPKSVWHLSYHKGLDEFRHLVQDEFYNPGLRKKGKGAAGVGRKKKLSEFSPLLAQRIVEYWSDEDDLIIDPFAGRGTRVLVAKAMDRRSIGLDISWEFISHINNKAADKRSLEDFIDDREIYVPMAVHTDSRFMPIPDETADFIYSCPPYWNIEKYEHRDGQLADIDDYKEFLREMGNIFKECYRILKNGKFMVIVVQDFRLWKKFYALGAHTVQEIENAGFAMYDNVIRSYTTNLAAKIPDAKAQKFTVKMHEYVIVARKDVDAPPIFDIIPSK